MSARVISFEQAKARLRPEPKRENLRAVCAAGPKAEPLTSVEKMFRWLEQYGKEEPK